MNRRQLFTAAGATAITVTAGCVGETADEDPDETSNDDNSEADSEGASENDDILENARDDLETASTEFEAEASFAFSMNPDPISASATETALANAEDELGAFDEGAANDEQQTTYENLQLAADYLGHLLDALLEIETAMDAQETAVYYEDAQRWGDAVDEMGTAETHYADAGAILSDASDAWDDFDASDGSTTDVELAAGADTLSELDETVFAYEVLAEGGAEYDSGIESYRAGNTEFEAEQYSEAAAEMETAEDRFGTANETFLEAEQEVPQSFREVFITLESDSSDFEEASRLCVRASNAAADGDVQAANEYLSEASELFSGY